MKILVVHELFMPDFSGGGEKLVYEMAKNLQNRGHEVKVLTTGDPEVKSYQNIQTIRIKRHRYLMNIAIPSILKEAKWADIIQTSTYNACFPSWLAGRILKKPVVCLIMSYWGKQWYELRGFPKGGISKLVEKIQVGRTFNRKIFLSDFSYKFSLNNGLSSRNSSIINPGIDTTKYQPLEKEHFVLFSGRFARQKGVYDVLEVARKLPDIKFVMMGWGEEESKLKQQAPDNVSFLDYSIKSGQNFFEQYGKSPLFFLPSYGETFGFTIVEAMAAGCAVVSTIDLGFQGKKVEIGDTNTMASAIQELIKDKEKMLEMGRINRELAKKFSWENFTDKLEKEYNAILDGIDNP